MSQRYLILDYETRSEADLKKTGSYEYSAHHSTQILCAAWRVGTREELKAAKTKCWSPVKAASLDSVDELIENLIDPEVKTIAHNALFEQVITRNVLSRHFSGTVKDILFTFNPKRWLCTAAGAASLALPRNLEGACHALGLSVQKDMEGRRLLLKYCKPRKPTKTNPAKWHSKLSDLKRIVKYCVTDIDAESELFLRLPPMNPLERKIWELDQTINLRGFKADRDLTTTVLKMISEETTNLNRETVEISRGWLSSTNQRGAVLQWLETQGVFLPDLRAKTVSDAISGTLVDGEAKRILQIRQAVSKTSTAKYQAFEIRSRTDTRVRDILMYHAASTGRWGGAGVQPHNLPKPTLSQKSIEYAIEVIQENAPDSLNWLRVLLGDPMSVFSSCLRSVIIPSEGKEIFCADYNAIEARVLFWVAKHEEGLQVFTQGRDLYREMAARIFGIKVSEITEKQRNLGKTAILGLGFGMGKKKFLETCKSQNQEIDERLAEVAVNTYRQTHHPVVKLWNNIDRAAIAAVQKKGTKFKINRTTWWVENNFLWCELPSKRRLAYFGPEVRYVLTPWGEKKPTLYHWGVNQLSRKWEIGGTYGGRLVENCVQAIARDLLAEAMLRVEDAGFPVVLTVHDEIIAEREKDTASVEEFESLMAELPSWAEGCPVKVKGWKGERYRK